MAATVVVPGAATVKIQVTGGSIVTLGYTRNGVEISEATYLLDVPGDENGGDEGTPIDVQHLSEAHVLRLNLTKWDTTVATELFKKTPGTTINSTLGTPAAAGTLLFAQGGTYRVLIDAANFDRNYPRCVLRGAIEHSVGSKYQALLCELVAYKDGSGVLWNTTMT